MSRTHKDRPYAIRAAKPRNGEQTTTWHDHLAFGKPVFRSRLVRDEHGNPVEHEYEINRYTRLEDGSYGYKKATRIGHRHEQVADGHYADYCTANISPYELGEGVHAPCTTYLRHGTCGTSSWTRGELTEFWGGDRRARRDFGRRASKEYRGDPDGCDDYANTPVSNHRHGVQWNW